MSVYDNDRYSNCRKGLHPLKKIYGLSGGLLDVAVEVRWCPLCGAVVVDGEHDGRIYAGYYSSMRVPQLVRDVQTSEKE